jgi:hypothetical protein
MQRIQSLGMLTVLSFVTASCAQQASSVEHLTVAQYLHDIDQADSIIAKGNNDPAQFADEPAYINANKAILLLSGTVNACWHNKPIRTANTDQACVSTWLKKQGYE